MTDAQDTTPVSTRKCPNCGRWSEWNQQPDDTCDHCGALLDPEGLRKLEMANVEKEKNKNRFSIDLLEIDPNEPFYLRGPKHVVRAVQISFVAVVSFIIWLIVAIAS